MRMRSAWVTSLLAAAICAWIGFSPAQAMTMESQNLADLVTGATDIVAGTVTEVTDTRLGNLPVTEVQLEVKQVLKGAQGATIDAEGRLFMTFRQFGLQAPEAAVDGRVFVGITPGMAQYEVGDQVLLFLGPTAPSGVRAPVGLGQGRFDLASGGVVNSAMNVGLFDNLPTIPGPTNEAEDRMLGTHEGVVNSRTFTNLVRRAVRENWWVDRDDPTPPRQIDDRDRSDINMTLGGN